MDTSPKPITDGLPVVPAESAAERKAHRRLSGVVGLALVAFIGLWLVIGLHLRLERQSAFDQASRDGANLALAFAHRIEAGADTIDGALRALRADYQDGPSYFRRGLAAFRDGAASAQVSQIGMVRADGRLAFSDGPRLDPHLSYARHEFFRLLSRSTADILVIGEPELDPASGNWSMPFARRLTAADGGFAGAIYFTVPTRTFARFLENIDVGAGGAIMLRHDSGVIVARTTRSAGADAFAGKPAALGIGIGEQDGMGGRSAGGAGAPRLPQTASWMRSSPLDGVVRLSSYRHLDRYPLAVDVALAEADIIVAHRLQRDSMIAVGGVISLGILLFAAALLRAERLGIAERRATEFSEARFRTLFAKAPLAYQSLDPEGRIIEVNEAWEKLFGYRDVEVRGRPISDFLSESSRLTLNQTFPQFIGSGAVDGAEFTIRCRDGSERLVSVNGRLSRHPDGRMRQTHCVLHDITRARAQESALKASEARLRSIVENIKVVAWELDLATWQFTFVSPQVEAMFGYPAGEWLRPNFWAEHLHPDDRVAAVQYRSTRSHRGQDHEYEYRFVRADGSLVWVRDIVKVLVEDDGRPRRLTGVMLDTTERRRDEEDALLARSVFESTHEGIMVTDTDAQILWVNPAFSDITGFTADEAVGRTPRIFKSGQHDRDFYAEMWHTLKTEGHWQGEIWNRRKDGELYVERMTINTVRDASGKPAKYVSLFSDVTLRKRQEEEIWRQANFDVLTGLANRNLFHDRLDRALARGRRNEQQVGLMFIDLDRFKWINDTLGHAAGDSLLVEAARRLRASVRGEDTVARLGGDEFTIVLQGLNDHEPLQAVADKVLAALAEPYDINGSLQYISGSIGITLYPDDGNSAESLLRCADIAMYRAKESGRNRYQFFSQDMQADALARIGIEKDLRDAIAAGWLELHYQPVVDTDSGELVAAEAFLRWRHPSRGLLEPVEFLGVAEDCGLMQPIGEWVLEESCRQWRDWIDQGLPPLRLSLNMSTVHFRDSGLHDSLAAALARWRVPGDMLSLDLTEAVMLDHGPNMIPRLQELDDLGLRFSLDNFGTGHSSLTALKCHPFDTVKIDRSFIAHCEANADDRHLVEAIVFMAHSLNLEVVAGGVESQAQFDLLHDLGCDFVQGFLIGRPLGAAEFAAFVADRAAQVDSQHTGEESRFLAALRAGDVDVEPWVGRLIAARGAGLAEHVREEGFRLGDLDLAAAIVSHMQWRNRIEAMIRDEACDRLSLDEAADDSLCTIGHWLETRTAGGETQRPQLAHLIRIHRDFHQLAASILADLELGRRAEARRRVRGLLFRKASHAVVTALIDLFVDERVAG